MSVFTAAQQVLHYTKKHFTHTSHTARSSILHCTFTNLTYINIFTTLHSMQITITHNHAIESNTIKSFTFFLDINK